MNIRLLDIGGSGVKTAKLSDGQNIEEINSDIVKSPYGKHAALIGIGKYASKTNED